MNIFILLISRSAEGSTAWSHALARRCAIALEGNRKQSRLDSHTASSAFNALGQPLPALGMSLSRLLLLYVPLAYLGSWLFGISGIFAAACLSNGVVGLGAWFWHSRWSHLPPMNSEF